MGFPTGRSCSKYDVFKSHFFASLPSFLLLVTHNSEYLSSTELVIIILFYYILYDHTFTPPSPGGLRSPLKVTFGERRESRRQH